MALDLPPGDPADVQDRRRLGSRAHSIVVRDRSTEYHPTGSRAWEQAYYRPRMGRLDTSTGYRTGLGSRAASLSRRPGVRRKQDVVDAMLAALSARFSGQVRGPG